MARSGLKISGLGARAYRVRVSGFRSQSPEFQGLGFHRLKVSDRWSRTQEDLKPEMTQRLPLSTQTPNQKQRRLKSTWT